MLAFVPTPIGNLEDITIRALRYLQESDVLLCEDTRVVASLISLLTEKGFLKEKITPRLISVHSHNEEEFLGSIDVSFFDQNVLYLSDAGMPCISDPGSSLVRYAQEHGIPYTVLPGANASLTAFVASGSPTKEFLFYGFLAHKQKQKKQEITHLLSLQMNVVIYESPHRLQDTLEQIATISPDSQIFVVKELTKMFERYYKGSVQEVIGQIDMQKVKGEWTIVLYASSVAQKEASLSIADLVALDLPPKIHAKILAKMQNKSVKACYHELISSC